MVSHLLPCLLFLLHIYESLCLVVTPGDLAVLEGRSVTVPCHYDPQYIHHVKYWCKGRTRDFCTTLARSQDEEPASNSRVSIFDDPTQLVFTVTMTELEEEDSSWYWCGVEVAGFWHADDASSLHISVVHGMSALHSMVHGQEGDSITVECQYSNRHRDSVKKWCRSGDWGSCVTTNSNGTFLSDAVEIRDDRHDAFTVTLLNIQRKDSGWYWCASGQQQVAVHVMVDPRPTTTPAVLTHTTPWLPGETDVLPAHPARGLVHHRHDVWMPSLVACLALAVLLLATLATHKLWRYYKRNQAAKISDEIESSLVVCPAGEADWKNTAIVFLNTSTQQLQVLGRDKSF